MKRYELGVKIKSLAAETTIIHEDEIRLKKAARKARLRQALLVADRLISSFWSLRRHRSELKEHSRATFIALAFLLGRPYSALESVSRTSPPLTRAQETAKRFGEERYDEKKWNEWANEASEHWKQGQIVLAERDKKRGERILARRTEAEVSVVVV